MTTLLQDPSASPKGHLLVLSFPKPVISQLVPKSASPEFEGRQMVCMDRDGCAHLPEMEVIFSKAGGEVRGERSPPGQVVPISALQMLREQQAMPRSVGSQVTLGGMLVGCNKLPLSNASWALLQLLTKVWAARAEAAEAMLSQRSISWDRQSLHPTKEGASQPKPLPTGPLPPGECCLFGNSGTL